jgi:hypothetical protein
MPIYSIGINFDRLNNVHILKRDLSYVAHEFMNTSFEPQYFTDVADEMKAFGLQYAGTSKLHRNWDEYVIPSRFNKYVQEPLDRQERESHRSFVRNEFFRRDIYIREGSSVQPMEAGDLSSQVILGATLKQSRFIFLSNVY